MWISHYHGVICDMIILSESFFFDLDIFTVFCIHYKMLKVRSLHGFLKPFFFVQQQAFCMGA